MRRVWIRIFATIHDTWRGRLDSVPSPVAPPDFSGNIFVLAGLSRGDYDLLKIASVTIKLLFPLLEKLAGCRKPTDVGGVAIDAMKSAFACHAGNAIFLDESHQFTTGAFFGLRLADYLEYEAHWRPQSRLRPVVLARAVPVHTGQVYTEDQWQKHAIFSGFCRPHRIYHVMAAPVFGSQGSVVGVLQFCRRPGDARFDATTLEMAAAFSGFLSATLSRVAGAAEFVADCLPDRLTPRESQVAHLAAGGRNNVEIALELGIARETVKQALRRVYRKLDVSGRAQMAATLAARGDRSSDLRGRA